MAHQCVYVYGNAVYLARALYSLDHPEEIMMDYLLCTHSYKKEEIAPNEKPIDFKIFPNPANESLAVVCNLAGFSEAVLQITDVTGQVVLTQKLNTNTPIAIVNTSQLASGMYYPKIVADHQLIGGKKIIITH